METRGAVIGELDQLMSKDEDHFFDLKSWQIAPAKLQETFVAFANADGGDIWVGFEDKEFTGERIHPFPSKEDANAILSVLLEQTKPSVRLRPRDSFYIFPFPKVQRSTTRAAETAI